MWPGVVVMMVLLGACRPAEEGATDQAPADRDPALVEGSGGGTAVVPADQVPVVEPNVPAAPVAEMWKPETAGIARHLPSDTSWYAEARHLEHLWEWFGQFQDSAAVDKVTELLESPEKIAEAAEAAGVEGLEEVPVEELEELREQYAEEGMTVVRALCGEEAFIAMRGLEWFADPLVFYQEKLSPKVVSKVVEAMANGDFDDLDDEEAFKELLAMLRDEMIRRLKIVDGKPVMGIQMGGKVSEGRDETLMTIREWISKGVEESDELTAHSFEKAGVTWTGMKLSWPDASMDEEFEKLREGLGEEAAKTVRESIAKCPLVMACGELGDYVVLYMGLGEHSLGVAGTVEESLAGHDDLSFLREFENDSLLGTYWVHEGLVDAAHRAGCWEPLLDGVAEGLAKSTKLESAPLMAESVRSIAALAKEREGGRAHASVGALVVDGGLRLEMRGGWQGVAVDLEAPLKLAGAMHGRDEAVLMRAHWKMSDAYIEQGSRQIDEIVKIARHIGAEIQTAMEGELEDADELEGEEAEERARELQMAELYKTDFVKSVEDLWTGYREHFKKAVGAETALMVDLAGKSPPIVGMDEELVDKGRIPRVAYLRPVESREELKKTWELWRGSGVRLLGIVSEVVETPIPFPDTLSADKDNLRTHFFSMPFASDDFLPCLSVSDELLMLGTSKAFSEELYETIVENPAEGDAPTGVIVELNGEAFWDFCAVWLDLSIAQAEALGTMDEELPEGLDEEDASDAVEEDAAVEQSIDENWSPDDPDAADSEAEEQPEDSGEEPEDELSVEESAAALMEALDLTNGSSWADVARQGLDYARWFRGASYRRWMDDDVPRSSWRLRWGDPAKAAD